jgi:hypothetical protein
MIATPKITPIPTPYIETILPGRNVIQGWVGEVVNNKIVPEKNAYIYIYVNGFLINPPEINSDGSYKNTKTLVLSDKNGDWSTGTFFFDIIPALEYGATITFKAKSLLKKISPASVPFAIGATPTPIELGVYDSVGRHRPPYEGESSIMGHISYWFKQLPDSKGYTGYPLFNCENKVYVYVDGVHEGTNNQTIGEVFKNEIRGTNATFPIYVNVKNQVLPIKVGTNQVNIPLFSLNSSDTPVLSGTQDGVNKVFTFNVDASNVGFRIFKNGIRIIEGTDYNYHIIKELKSNATTVEVTLFIPPYASDDIEVVFQYNITSMVLHEKPQGVIDGVNLIYKLDQSPFPGTLELYKNGLKLDFVSPINDYVLQGNILTLVEPLVEGDTLVADYQPLLQNAVPLVFNLELFGQIDSPAIKNPNASFLVTLPDSPGNIHVFKNGLKLQEGVNRDYTLNETGNVINFTSIGIPETGDILNASFYVAPITLAQLVSYLNNAEKVPEFASNCLVASILNVQTIQNYFIMAGVKNGVNRTFSLPLADVPVNLRLYKNGKRLTNISSSYLNGDYTVDLYNSEVTFIVPPSINDVIEGLFTYKLTDFLTEQKPVKVDSDLTGKRYSIDFVPKKESMSIYINGIRLNPLAVPSLYSIENNEIIFDTAPSDSDVIVVDYEISYGLNSLISNIIPSPLPNGSTLTFTYAPQLNGTAINVFRNGFLVDPTLMSITNNSITFKPRALDDIPQYGDSLIIEFNLGTLFTDNPKDQLKISSSYPIELVETSPISYIQNLLFGSSVVLWPGKDDDGEFKFWFNRQTGFWKWTWYDPYTFETKTFKKGQHITARAYNSAPINYHE